jgi:acetyl esterase
MRLMTQMIGIFMVMTTVHAGSIKPSEVVTYKTVGDVKLNLYIHNPPNHKKTDKTPAIVFFFGGGWISGVHYQFAHQSSYLASRGMVAICVDYRIQNTHKTTPVECVKDGKSAMRWVRAHAAELGIDPNRIAAGGGSAGGHIAAATALVKGFEEKGEDTSVSCRPDALVLFNPVIDNGPGGYGYDRVKDYWEAFSPMNNIDKTAPPTIIFLGTKDEIIPVKTVQTYQQKMKDLGLRCDLKLYEGLGHGFFNKHRGTLLDADKFLISLGYLEGEPTLNLEEEKSEKEKKKKSQRAELSTQYPKEGLGLSLYYARGRDWPRPQGPASLSPAKPVDNQKYVGFMTAQVTELLTNYGPITAMWIHEARDPSWRCSTMCRTC